MKRHVPQRVAPGSAHAAVPLGAALNEAFHGLGLKPRYLRQLVIERWSEAVGPELAAHCRAFAWQGDVLLVEVDEPAWAQQCALLAGQLLERIHAVVGDRVVRRLRFVIRGRPLPLRRERQAVQKSQGPAASNAPQPPDLAGFWREQVERIPDRELARAMAAWLGRQLERRGHAGAACCPGCGAPRSAGDRCVNCRVEWRPGGIRQSLYALLREEPWLSLEQVQARLGPIDARMYGDVKEKLTTEWKSRMQELEHRYGRSDRLPAGARSEWIDAAIRYLCLQAGVQPAELRPSEVVGWLGKRAAALFTIGEVSKGD